MPPINKNFYNLPPSWNPGYAIPDSVYDENLERRAFITAMTPRGTYDDPSISNAGYAVPRYIDDEGYGQGAFMTKWLPRGYYGPKIPQYLDESFSKIVGESPASGGGVVLKMETLGDDAPGYSTAQPRDPFQQFGRRAAAALMLHMDRLPERTRPAAMRKALDAMDPKLYQRTIVFADRLLRRGARPRQALAHGLAAGITEGMLAELKRTGATRSAPQAHSLPGLGCYGCDAALGATPTMTIVGKLTGTAASTSTLTNIVGIATQSPTTGACPAGQIKYNWKEAANGVAAHWERARSDESGYCFAGAPSGAPGGVTVTNTATGEAVQTTVKAPPQLAPMVQIGPWVFPGTGGTIRTHMSAIPAEWGAFVAQQIANGASKAKAMQQMQNLRIEPRGGIDVTTIGKFTFASIDGALLGKPGTRVNVLKNQIDGSFPLVKVKNPLKNNEWYALYLNDLGQNGDGSFVLTFKQMDIGWLQKAFDWIKEVVAKIVDVVKDAVAAVADLACQLVSAPGATAAAAAASGGTAAVGTAIAAGLCATPQPVPIPPPPAPSSDLTIPIAVGAGAIGLALLLKRKKKA